MNIRCFSLVAAASLVGISCWAQGKQFMESGKVKFDKGDNDGAILDYNKSIELNPKDAGAYASRGAAKGANDDYEGAIADFSKAIEIDPNAKADLLPLIEKAKSKLKK